MAAALQLVAALAFPAVALFLVKRVKAVAWLGPVGLCYSVGLALANAPGLKLDRGLSLGVAEAAVPLSLPLLLFSTHLRRWLGLARAMVLGFGLAALSAVASAAAHGWLFRERLDEAWKIAGMLVGVYVGGTSNMSGIGLALGVREETFVLLNATDLLLGGAYLLFVLTAARPVLLLFLPRYRASAGPPPAGEARSEWRRDRLVPMVGALLASAAIVAAGAGLSWLVFGELVVPVVLVLITTLGLVGSLSPRLRENEGGYQLGEYLLLVFCVAMGSLADVRELANARVELFLMVAAVQVTAIALHYLLCAAFRIDADTALVCSAAAIFGPAFIGPVARSLGNRELVAGGVAAALVGLGVANYLGLLTAWALKP